MSFFQPKVTELDGTTLTITDLNTVQEEDVALRNQNISFPIPGTNTSGNRLSNWFGKVRSLTVSGIHYGEGYSEPTVRQNINAFITEVEAWVNSGFQNRRIYHDLFGNQYRVFCVNFQRQWVETNVSSFLIYSFELIEGGDIITDFPDLLP